MDYFYLSKQSINRFLNAVSKTYHLYLPESINEDYRLVKYSREQEREFIFNKYRAIESVKTFLAPLTERLCGYFSPDSQSAENVAVIGLKSCDLFTLKVQDYVYKEGIEIDPLYSKRRENLLIISSDCTDFKEVCFCLSLGILPYPKECFDLNLSPLNDGYLVEAATEKAKKLIDKNKIMFQEPSSRIVENCRSKREKLIERLNAHLDEQNLPPKEILQRITKSGNECAVWKEEAIRCVECGACNFSCPTCHCFLIFDIGDREKARRYRMWDACQYANFARVAGGANPLGHRYIRLRNRYLKKFDFFATNLGAYACSGCGRCIESCPAEIDIREIFRRLAQYEKSLQAQ